MQNDIPIIVSTKKPNGIKLTFQISSRQKSTAITRQSGSLRQKCSHETLNYERGNFNTRKRRISSSGTKKRFPKDFFKPD